MAGGGGRCGAGRRRARGRRARGRRRGPRRDGTDWVVSGSGLTGVCRAIGFSSISLTSEMQLIPYQSFHCDIHRKQAGV